jgi:hypothetical protein
VRRGQKALTGGLDPIIDRIVGSELDASLCGATPTA